MNLFCDCEVQGPYSLVLLLVHGWSFKLFLVQHCCCYSWSMFEPILTKFVVVIPSHGCCSIVIPCV
jgi:hypothetical protein